MTPARFKELDSFLETRDLNASELEEIAVAIGTLPADDALAMWTSLIRRSGDHTHTSRAAITLHASMYRVLTLVNELCANNALIPPTNPYNLTGNIIGERG